MNSVTSQILKFLVILTIVSGFSAFIVLYGAREDVDAKVISLNKTVEEPVYVNPPFVVGGTVYYYDVQVGNKTITIGSSDKLIINSTIKIRL